MKRRKHGLNLFVNQLIGIVGLLMVICIGIVTSFYYTNTQVLTNYGSVMEEENERNALMRIEMLVNLARQAEKSFYARQNEEDAGQVLRRLDLALEEISKLDHGESHDENRGERVRIVAIGEDTQRYRDLFEEALSLWRARGFTRDEGVSRELRQAAYEGLRSQLSRHNTHGLQALLDRMRWQEYEFYLYWSPRYITRIHTLIDAFRNQLEQAGLVEELSRSLSDGIDGYARELTALSKRRKGSSHQALENQAKAMGKVLADHTIPDFNYLLRTLLYYEMEYRELGRQKKHVEGVHRTLGNLSGRIEISEISREEKRSLLTAIGLYRGAFDHLVQLDEKIAHMMEQTTLIMERLNPDIQNAVAMEEKVMADIRQRTQASNRLHNMINLGVMAAMVLLAAALVAWMVSRLGGKVGRIGGALAQIARGDMEVAVESKPENRRDELDQISHDVGVVAASLKETMGRLHDRNAELEVISKRLAKYLSPQVYASIFSGRQEARIQSQRKKLTIFFSDIVGFTNTTDSMESEELTTLLNAYLNEMSNIALEYGGTIDKFIGDAIMIFFGDPESKGEKEDAIACVSMAIAMRDRLKDLRRIWREEQGFQSPFRMRIGMTTGYCTVGNFGSDERMDYTIIGGNVNLASRLEHQAEPDTILISHETYALVKEQVVCVPQSEIRVKGIAHPVNTYRVEGFRGRGGTARLRFDVAGDGFAVQVDGDRLDGLDRENLASEFEEMARKLRE